MDLKQQITSSTFKMTEVMKKTLIYALAASVAFLASCAKEATVKETAPFTISFGTDVKSYINYQGHTFWTPKDQISVFSDQGTRKVFITTTEDGATTKDFTCEDWVVGEVPQWAVFCYEDKATPSKPHDVTIINDGKFLANVAANQPMSVDNSFGSKANISVASITNNEGTYSGQMKNALGLVKITIPKGADNVAEIILEDAAGTAPIAGQVQLDCTGDEPVCTPVTGQGKSSISAKWSKTGSFTATKAVYFCVVPGVAFTPKFTFVKTDGSKASVTGNKAISVSRNKYFDCGTPSSLDFVPEGYKKVVVDLNFAGAATWQDIFNEKIVSSGNQQKASPHIATYTEKVTGYKFNFASGTNIVGSNTAHGTYTFTGNDVSWYNSNDGTQYVEIVCPENGSIASISLSANVAKGNGRDYAIVSSDDTEDIFRGTIDYVFTDKLFDLTGSTKAKYGCRIRMITTTKKYALTDIKVTYFIPEEEE